MKILAKNLFWFLLCFICLASSLFLLRGADAQNNSLSYGDSDVPVILPRSTWENTASLQSLMTWMPETQKVDTPSDWQPVERIVVHDTGCDPSSNPTCNNNIDPIATIQAIYRYHAVTRGWGDIGYNYIIDQQGRIYEGRYGGNGSRGAHTYYDRARDNFNYGSIGISLLGNYAQMQPSDVVMQSLERLVGWLAVLNGLDPQGQSSSYIWNATKGGFKSYFSGPVILGHKDIEPGNPDPALIDFGKLRAGAGAYAVKFKDYLYQRSSDTNIYQIVNGTRRAFADLASLSNQSILYGKIVNISSAQLNLFSETRFLKYPDGTLVQIKGEAAVYLIEGGRKRAFKVDAKQFVKLGFNFGDVKQVTADELISYFDALAIKYGPDKKLLSDGVRVYLMENGRRRWITSDKLFSLLGYKWSLVQKIEATEILTFLEGDSMLYPDGTLLQESGKPDVYLMKGGQKHRFVSAQSFLKLGFKWSNIILAEPIEIALAGSGDIVTYLDGTLIKADNNPSVFLVEKGAARPFLNADIFLARGYKWSQILKVSAEELAFYPAGKYVSYPDGWLLRPNDRNDVYLISGGAPQAIDAATFVKRKYKWVNVKVVLAQDFGVLYEGKSIVPAVIGPTPIPTPSISPTPIPFPAATVTPSPSTNAAAMPKIRVAIFEVATPSVTLTANSAYDIFDKNGQIVVSKNANENFIYNITSRASVFAKIVPRSTDGIVQIVSYDDHPGWKPSLNYNQFRGSMEIVYSAKSDKIWAVNELWLEDYLKGVAETSQGLNMEYLKTMSVAARTYAYNYQKQKVKYGADEVYHITNTTADQLYKGYAREQYASDIVASVQSTFGEIVTYNGNSIVTAYSSGAAELMNSGSRSACSVWGGKYCQPGYEYLSGGVKDPEGTQYSYSSCGVSGNHCVGLSGAGTRQLAAQGKTYKEILMYYYPGTTIQKLY